MWWSNLCVISLGNVGNGFDVEVTGLLGFADQMGSSCTGKRLSQIPLELMIIHSFYIELLTLSSYHITPFPESEWYTVEVNI
jgi:hypothetical protein